jgi:hypothetical protein
MLLSRRLKHIYTFITSLKAIKNLTHIPVLSILKTLSLAAPAPIPQTLWIGGGDVGALLFRNISGVNAEFIVIYITLGFTRGSGITALRGDQV